MDPTKGTTMELQNSAPKPSEWWSWGVWRARGGAFWGSQASPPALGCNIHSTNVTTFHVRHVEKGLGSRAPPRNLTVFPDSSTLKESACNAGDPGLYSWVRKICWRSDRLLHYSTYSSLENSMDCIVHEVTKSWIQLSDFHFHYMKATYQPLTDSSYLLLTVLLLWTAILNL